MNDQTLSLLRQKLHETYEISPNHFGNQLLDAWFVKIASLLKTFPFKLYVPLAIFVAIALYMTIGFLIVRLATLLQYGF